MDIFSHGLWTGAAYKGINLKSKRPLNVWLAAFWGVFPDLFAFTIPFVWFLWNLAFSGLHLSDIPEPGALEPGGRPKFFGNGDMHQARSAIQNITAFLYNLGHSAVIFLLVFGIVILCWKLFRKPNRIPWEMGGWLIHIFLDVPTHSYGFFPTPIFWPLAGWKFNGYSWAHLWFIVINYSAIIIAYFLLRILSKKKVS